MYYDLYVYTLPPLAHRVLIPLTVLFPPTFLFFLPRPTEKFLQSVSIARPIVLSRVS